MIPILNRRLGRFGGSGNKGLPVVVIEHAKNGTFSITFRGTNGAVVYCDPGDGSAVQAKTLLGASTDVVFSYGNDGTSRVIRIFGSIKDVTYLNIYQEPVYSDLDELCKFCNLTYLRLTRSPFTGSIFCLGSLVKLTWLSVQQTATSGSLASLISLTNLDEAYMGNNPYSLSSIVSFPSWDGSVYRFDDCSMTSGDVDRMLISLANSGVNSCAVYLAGNNQARTSASDTAVSTLLGNSVTLFVNE